MTRTAHGGDAWETLGDLDRREKQYAALTDAVAAPAGGEALCALIRTTNKFDFMMSTRSPDMGRTWSPCVKTDLQGHPGDIADLGDGRLMCVFALLPGAEGAREPGMRLGPGAFLAVYQGPGQAGRSVIHGTRFEIS